MCEPTFTIFIMMRCHGVSLAWVSCHSWPVWPSGVGTGLERRPGTQETQVQAPAPVTHRVSGSISQPQAIPDCTWRGYQAIRDWPGLSWKTTFIGFIACLNFVKNFKPKGLLYGITLDCCVFTGPTNSSTESKVMFRLSRGYFTINV